MDQLFGRKLLVNKEFMQEKFIPIKLASFNRDQLVQVVSWAHRHIGFVELDGLRNISYPALTSAEFDERGNPMDKDGILRLKCALEVLNTIKVHGRKVERVKSEILVWSTQYPSRYSVEWCPRLDDVE